MAEGKETRPPRGALAVIAVGLVATVAAAALANEHLSGEAAHLEWVQLKKLPDSKPAQVPGGGGQLRLTDAGLRTTGTNVSGYTLFRSAAMLVIDSGAPVGSARIKCAMHAPGGTEVAQTPDLRDSFPRSSDELTDQPVPETLLAEFASHGETLATIEVPDLPEFFSTEKGLKLEWPPYTVGTEHWRWFLPPGRPSRDLELPFYALWKATKPPAIEISCDLKTSAGVASVQTAGAMRRMPEAINEEEDE